MLIAHDRNELNIALKQLGAPARSVGFVATMGALHSGHIALLEKANTDCDISVCTIFVNPTQFNEKGDFDKYPRRVDSDSALLKDAGCDILYLPQVDEVYPPERPRLEDYEDALLFNSYEAVFRPGHFPGVVTVVMRLFEHIRPNKAYFGLKDYQQYLVVKRATPHFFEAIDVVGVPTIRSKNGLALSSRNFRLNESELEDALVISHVLREIASGQGQKPPDEWKDWGMREMESKGLSPEYLQVCDAENLQPVSNWEEANRYVAVCAAFVGEVRLIDNILFEKN